MRYFLILLILGITQTTFAIDQCIDYKIDVKNYHIKYFGPDFPWWYGLGQLKQESRCREKVTAFDGGMGIAQFMPTTAEGIYKQMGTRLNPYKHEDAIKMQAFFMKSLHKQNKFPRKPLWITYQGYNGGFKWLQNEYKRAGSSDWQLMKNQCQRKTIKLKNGNYLSFCEVNYDYSKKVYKYGSLYRSGVDGYEFW